MSALGRVVRSGVGRRRVQTVVIGLVVTIAVTAAVLGGSLLVAAHAPFDRAFGQQRGAHLSASFDPARTTPAQLAASARAAGVTAAAGPFRTAALTAVDDRGRPHPPLTVAGRADPAGPVDAVTLLEGRWATRPGELVVFTDGRPGPGTQLGVGDVLRLPGLTGRPSVTVVGKARSVSRTADGWVTPAQAAAWAGADPAGSAPAYQMLYRFAAAGSAGEMATARAAVAASVPAGALAATRSWLTVRQEAAGDAALFVPFLIAFGALGLLMAVIIVGNVVAGAVSTATRRIGILKALGFTPHQVVRAYLGQALIPAVAGAALGVVAGNALAVPVLSDTDDLFGTAGSGVAPWVDVAVVAGTLVLVTVTAWAAAARAGRLRTVDALAVGRTPRPGRGRWAARTSGRLPLPRPLSLGLAYPFARPIRTVTMIGAIAFGAAAATFAVGLGSSLHLVQAADGGVAGGVTVLPGRPGTAPPGAEGGVPVERPGGPGPGAGEPAPLDAATVVAAIAAQPGTASYRGIAATEVTLAGNADPVEVLGLSGDSSPTGYRMVSGAWFTGPGQVVVATPFLTATQTRVGDSVDLLDDGTRLPVRIVGEVFNTENDGMQVLTAAETLAAADPDLRPMRWAVTLEAGVDRAGYAQQLSAALGEAAFAVPNDDELPSALVIIDALAALLTLLLLAVAVLGVLNLVVLETRERVHDLGVHKALGMTPRQTVAMVVASVVVTGAIGGALGTPAGVVVQRLVVTEMGATAGFALPDSMIDVYGPGELLLFVLGGLLIAVAGSLLPAGWAARTRTATALRTE